MRLARLSLLFSAVLLLSVGMSGLIALQAMQAFDRVQTVQDHRLEALHAVEALRRDTDTLTRLVRAYTVTGETRFLSYYHALQGIRAGALPVPDDPAPTTYWDRVIAGETLYLPASSGPGMSQRQRMIELGFDARELSALATAMDEAETLKAMEQNAIAATRSAYNPDNGRFNGGHRFDPGDAVLQVYGQDYDRQRARLTVAIANLLQQVDARTTREVGEARDGLRAWIAGAVAGVAVTAVLVVLGLRTTRRELLHPIEDISAVTGQLARGQYDVRLPEAGHIAEIRALRQAVNSMARAVERDIAEREFIQRELGEARTRAELATQAKSMFLANMSHEIRTPLNAVIGMAELMLHSPLAPRQREYADKIHSAGRTLRDIVNDILDFTKIEAGHLELERIPFRLEGAIANALLPVEQSAAEKGVELIFEATANSARVLDRSFLGDPVRVGQILGNLLSNAVKFTPSGHVSLRVDGQNNGPQGMRVSITVEDTGIGMRPEQIERLFDDFTQADGATTRQFGGTGLGLAIVRRLVDAMGGQIRVHSQPKQGSTFQVVLPLGVDTTTAPRPAPELPAEFRVLVVDDTPAARLALIDLLHLSGVDEVDSASDRATALECLDYAVESGFRYDLLLLDDALPGNGTRTLFDDLQQHPARTPRHLALLSTGECPDDSLPETAECPIHRCDKPLLPGALARLFDRVLGRSPARSDVPASGEVGALDGMRVLLVEDNATSRDVAVALMGRWGVEVDSAVDGRDALSQLAAHPPEHYGLVFMDLQMPVMDGYEATRRLRAQPIYAGLPVYALSAHSGRQVTNRCLALGMNGCLDKPYEVADLYRVLHQYYRGEGRAPGTLPSPSDGRPVLEGLDRIPGLDPRCAINDTGISATLYPRLLQKFRDQFADGPSSLRADVAAHAWDRVAPFAHTLKGRAGLLGMGEISAIAGRLEAAAHAGDFVRAERLLIALEAHLRPLVEGLARALPASAGDGDPIASTSCPEHSVSAGS